MPLLRKNFTECDVYPLLVQQYAKVSGIVMRDLFLSDKDRAKKFSIGFGEVHFDYSKNLITEESLSLLVRLAEECGVAEATRAMFSGELINETEKRAVLHTAARAPEDEVIEVNGHNVVPGIQSVLKRMKDFSEQVISGAYKGYTGKAITDIVNIGIGGSDLGPYMATEALKPYRNHLNLHFVSNVDGSQIQECLRDLRAETTLILVSSKTFTTQETMANAATAREWFLNSGATESDITRHFIGISTSIDEANAFGIQTVFEFWDWIGGRFSLWSAIGLSICLGLGFDAFRQLLDGARATDEHFQKEPFGRNIPVIMALLSVWYNNFFGSTSEAVLPYDQHLHRLPAYLQQLVMESNGKRCDREGNSLSYPTSPVIWGEPGTNGQHAFFQLLHQGTQLIPCDFIGVVRGAYPERLAQQDLLLTNLLAQSRTLMLGDAAKETADTVENYNHFPGNKPSNTLLFKELSPFNLGVLIALYEHKTFVQGILWNINSFDQWGVQLGKEVAMDIGKSLRTEKEAGLDASTLDLLSMVRNWQ